MSRRELPSNRERDFALLRLEREAFAAGYKRVAGVDEAGRGPLAGPVVAAACVLFEGLSIEGIDDSKKLDATKRELLFEQLTTSPLVAIGTGLCDALVIDRINILQATLKAMAEAIRRMRPPPDYLLVDGNQLPRSCIPARAVPKGDSLSLSVAAASIIAKVTRDRIMVGYHALYPEYGFDRHKGYPTQEHFQVLTRLGPCPIHRRSFRLG